MVSKQKLSLLIVRLNHGRVVRNTLICASIMVIFFTASISGKDQRREHPTKGNLCIARFETSGEPLYYNCPKANEPEKKSYCCYLDKCCDFKEFQKQKESQFKAAQVLQSGYLGKSAIGSALKVILWIILSIILIIVGCCCLTFFLCSKKKLFKGGVFNTPLPAQPPGPSPYAPPANPYMAYQWPPETSSSGAPPAYPSAPGYMRAPYYK